VTWPAGAGVGRLLASAWLEDRSTKPAGSTRVPARARRPVETAFHVRTHPAVRAPAPTWVLPGRVQSARSALPVPASPAAADRMARAGPSPRVPPLAGAPVIRLVGATAAARAGPVAPAVAVAKAASAGPDPTRGAGVSPAVQADPMTRGAGVSPAVQADPMTRGARVSPAWPAAVGVARTTPAAVGVAAGARSAA
jgi:hypothetical protein